MPWAAPVTTTERWVKPKWMALLMVVMRAEMW
jgi:hypothetical protein